MPGQPLEFALTERWGGTSHRLWLLLSDHRDRCQTATTTSAAASTAAFTSALRNLSIIIYPTFDHSRTDSTRLIQQPSRQKFSRSTTELYTRCLISYWNRHSQHQETVRETRPAVKMTLAEEFRSRNFSMSFPVRSPGLLNPASFSRNITNATAPLGIYGQWCVLFFLQYVSQLSSERICTRQSQDYKRSIIALR